MAWREDVEFALRDLGGVAHLNDIYAAVERLTTRSPLPPSWRAIVRRELEYNSSDSDSYKHKQDLFYMVEGKGKGVWGLRAALPTTPLAGDLNPPDRVETTTYRILRDTLLARQLKKLHRDQCQLCGLQLELRPGVTYSEAHHIQPLGEPHRGPDVAGNILVLCPTCHVQCDYAAIELSSETVRTVEGHDVDQRYFDHHNERWRALGG